MKIYRYSEDEAMFLLIDGRNVEIPRFRKPSEIHTLCLLHQADGIAIVDTSAVADYALSCYDSDGRWVVNLSAARCSVAFADLLGVKPFHSQDYTFEAADGVHRAYMSSHLGECKTISIDGAEAVDTICMGELS